MLQVAVIFVAIVAGTWIIRSMIRSAERNHARRTFTSMMRDVHEWSIRRNDLELTARALRSLTQHRELLDDAQRLSLETGKASWRSREFLLEYLRCEERHRRLCDLDYPDNDMYEQAMELQEAIDALDAKRGAAD